MLVFSVKSKGSTTFLSLSHHLSSFFLIIWILNQGWNLFGKKRIDVFISPRFKCAIVDIFTMLMLRSFGLCLIKCVTYHSGWRPRGIVTHFIRQSPKDRSITTMFTLYLWTVLRDKHCRRPILEMDAAHVVKLSVF